MLCLYSCHLNDLKYLFYKCIFSNSSEERRNRPFWCIFFSVVVLMRRWSTSATWTARLCASCCGAPSETWASLTTSSGDFSPCHFHPQHGFFSFCFFFFFFNPLSRSVCVYQAAKGQPAGQPVPRSLSAPAGRPAVLCGPRPPRAVWPSVLDGVHLG